MVHRASSIVLGKQCKKIQRVNLPVSFASNWEGRDYGNQHEVINISKAFKPITKINWKEKLALSVFKDSRVDVLIKTFNDFKII